MKNTRVGLGKGLGMGYKNIVPIDSHIHSLSAKGIGTKVFPLVRVPYGKKSTPKKDREYKLQGGNSPVGTIQEWKQFGKKSGVDKLHINEMDGSDFYVNINAKGTTLNMMGLDTMKRLNEEASRKARNLALEPYEVTSKSDMKKMPPFPFPYIGENYTPRGWKKVNEYFVDSSGFGADDEMALSVRQFLDKMKVGSAYAITSAGQFQVYVSEFVKIK